MRYTYWLHEKIQKDINEGFAWYEDKLEGLEISLFLKISIFFANHLIFFPGSVAMRKFEMRHQVFTLKKCKFIAYKNITGHVNNLHP